VVTKKLIAHAVLVVCIATLPSSVAAGGGGHCWQPFSTGTGTEVSIDQICYQPTVVYVQASEQVMWINHDQVPHTVTGVQESWGDHSQIGFGESLSHTFQDAGVFPYFCALHFGQMGVVVVGEAGEAADAASAADDSGAGNGSIAAALGLGGLLVGAGGALAVGRVRRRGE
jgi:plastocyanin